MWEIFNPYNGKTLGWSRSEYRARRFIALLGDYGIPADYDFTPKDSLQQTPYPILKLLVN